ncbi:hypothetical protein D3C72_1511060 [compost metagenome]
MAFAEAVQHRDLERREVLRFIDHDMVESKVPVDLIHAGEQIQKCREVLFLDDIFLEIGLSHFENGFGYISFHILNIKALHFLNSDKSFIQGYRR